jgi:predicted HAD superfamily hydrolase
MKLTATDRDIVQTFEQNFSHLKSEPIALYGVGEKTRLLLDHLNGYHIVGILDKNSAGFSLYGKDVITLQEATAQASTIIIVANYSSAEIIYKRIAHIEKLYHIPIFHMNGRRMHAPQVETSPPINVGSFDNLREMISASDVISFDIVDTIYSRRCLFPSDVFCLVEEQAKIMEGHDLDFTALRIEAEKCSLQQLGDQMTIHDIYAQLADMVTLAPQTIDQIKSIEIETEIRLAQPREDIIEAFNYAQTQNKQVVLTSDMYFPADIMAQILEKIGLNGQYLLVVSCDSGKSKYRGTLWDHYLELFANKTILHIGDDQYADIDQAQKRGIRTFRVLSPKQLYESSPLTHLSNHRLMIEDRVLLGQFITTCFNSPFHDSANPLDITRLYDIGYLFYGPLILNYMLWLLRISSQEAVSKILFIARDGYILEKLYRYIQQPKPEGIYFYSSRRALAVSSITNTADIEDVFRTFFLNRKITFERFLDAAFGIQTNDNDKIKNKFLFDLEQEALLTHILREYQETILRNAHRERTEYLQYIQDMGISDGEKIGVINFVSSGVTQHFFEKLLPESELFFFYFLTKLEMKEIAVNSDRVNALYGQYINTYTDSSSNLGRHYLTGEAVLSAPDEQFVKIEHGVKRFRPPDEESDFSGIAECHRGIERFFLDMLAIDPHLLSRSINTELADDLFGLMFSPEKVTVTENIKKHFVITDDYAPARRVTGLW